MQTRTSNVIVLFVIVLSWFSINGVFASTFKSGQEPNHADQHTIHNVFTVQVGAFLNEKVAERSIAKLNERGYEAFILMIFDANNRAWYTVHVGKFSTKSEAKSAARMFQKREKKPGAYVLRLDSFTFSNFLARRKIEDRSTTASPPPIETSYPSGEVINISEEIVKSREEVAGLSDKITMPIDKTEEVKRSIIPQTSRAEKETSVVMESDQTEWATAKEQKEFGWLSRNTRGWYIGAGAGVSRVHSSGSDLDRKLADRGHSTTSDVDQTNFGWKVLGGNRFHENLALEVGYVGLGQVDVTINAPVANTAKLTQDTSEVAPLSIQGGLMEVVGVWPIRPQLSLLGKVGGIVWEGKANIGQVAHKKHGTDWILGMGAQYRMNQRFSTRVEWERFLIKDKVDLLSAGVEAHF